MPNVVTPFNRKHDSAARKSTSAPRHRRDGYFDEQDKWHDSTEAIEPASQHSAG